MKAALVILNWNTKGYLKSFLPALIQSCRALGCDKDGGALAEVVVADSSSTDGSMNFMKEAHPDVLTLPLYKNYGFSGGYNRAFAALEAKGMHPEYYILINSDICVGGNWLAPLVSWMDKHPECGVCGPKLHALMKIGKSYVKSSNFEYAGAAGGLLDRYGFPYCRGRVRKKTATDHGQYDEITDVLWITGACMMVRASLWKKLGGLDERFFAHMEEIDFCWRAQLAGYKVTVVPESLVWHLGGGTLPQNSPWKLQLNFRNNLLMLENNLPDTYRTLGFSAEKAAKKSRNLLAFRRFLDNCARIVYFCTGKLQYARAVSVAHQEWAELREQAPARPPIAEGATVAGLTKNCILFKKV